VCNVGAPYSGICNFRQCLYAMWYDGHLLTSVLGVFEGELNLEKRWQSDDLFHIIMNEIHPRFNQFCMILKLS